MEQIICTVDVVLLTLQDEELKVALLKREHEPYQGLLALPGGYVQQDKDSDARDAALRVLSNKTGIHTPYLEQLATFSGASRDPRGWSVSISYYALVAADVIARAQHPELHLVNVDRYRQMPFDHRLIIDAAVQRLRSKSQYSSLPCHLAGQTFTLPQLQRIYEVLMGEDINKVSFRRKIQEMDMLETADGEYENNAAHRPAQLYRLKAAFRQQLQILERGL